MEYVLFGETEFLIWINEEAKETHTSGNAIVINPNEAFEFKGQDGKWYAETIEGVLAHELGHLLEGHGANLSLAEEQRVEEEWENYLTRELKRPRRGRYRDTRPQKGPKKPLLPPTRRGRH